MLDVPQVGSSSRANTENSRGVSPDSIDSWRDQITEGEAYICEKINGAAMAEFGYKLNNNSLPTFSLLYNALLFPIHALGVVLTNPGRAIVQLRAYMNK